jgi:hypothetical protein
MKPNKIYNQLGHQPLSPLTSIFEAIEPDDDIATIEHTIQRLRDYHVITDEKLLLDISMSF